MVGIPEAGVSDALAICVMSEPALRGRIKARLVVVAEERDGISLDEAAQALRASFILNREPKERHVPDDLAHLALQDAFTYTYALATEQPSS